MKFWAIALLTMAFTLPAIAQTSLVGRVYSDDNVMKKQLDDATKDIDKKIAEAKAEAVAKAEKKKGRKLTAAEIAEIDKKLKEARTEMESVKKGMKTSVSVNFKTADEVVMSMKVSVSDAAMKAAGIGWLKRKAIKAAMAIAPSTQKMKYVVQGDLVICSDGKDKDTLRLSKDRQFVYGKIDEKTSFTLKLTK